MPVTENNGFSIIGVDADRIVFRMFVWLPPQDIAEIDTMEPAFEYVIDRTSGDEASADCRTSR